MAVLPDYVTGTITLANGSTTVTGTGTMFETADFRPGDTLQIQNLTAIIASVDSNTSLTLTEPWTGTSLINAPYRARYLPDGARVTAQTTTLIELLGNGVLTNLAELGVEEGKTPVGGPTGEYELVDTSSFGIQDPNGNLQALAGLTSAADTMAYFTGAGTAGLTALTPLGRAFLALTGTNGNIPVMTGEGTVASRPIVGPVSGITGALMDYGNNANGFYFRFANRLQICFNREFVLNQVASYQVYNTWTFPAAFNSYNVSFFGAPRSTGGRGAWASGSTLGTGDWGVLDFSVIASNFTSVDVALNKITAAANLTGTQSMPVHVAAIGFY